jgi:hypothetical protein
MVRQTSIFYPDHWVLFLQSVLSCVYLGMGTAVVSFLRKYEQTFITSYVFAVCSSCWMLIVVAASN